MPTEYHELRKKYPKWAHRKDEHRKRKRKRSRRRRRSRRRAKKREKHDSTSTEGMLLSLLHQLMLGGTLAKKHGENVITGYADKVNPDSLAPVRSRHLMREAMAEPQQGGAGAGAGAAAVVRAPPPAGYPPE